MSDHTTTRLETTDGRVVAYFAPEAVVRPIERNDPSTSKASDALQAPSARDRLAVTSERQVSATLQHSTTLPDAHRSDVESMIGSAPATPRDQLLRLWHFATDPSEGGPFHFYDGTDAYDVAPGGTVDWESSFPQVQISQIRSRRQSGQDQLRLEVDVILRVGWEGS